MCQAVCVAQEKKVVNKREQFLPFGSYNEKGDISSYKSLGK